MRRLPYLLVVSMLFSSLAFANVKLGYVDLQRALGEVLEGKAAKEKLKRELDKRKAELDGEQDKLRADKAVLDKQSAMMAEETRNQKFTELQKRLFELTQKAEKMQGEMAQAEQSELKKIWQPDETGSVKPHATTMNLIALHGRRDSESFEQAVEDVAARLSARTFLVSVDPRLEPWALDGDVSAVCRIDPSTKKEAVCSERVQLRFGAMVSKRALSIVDALVEASLPSAIFVGPGAHAAVVDSLVDAAESVQQL